jgi:hypothetical protein
VFDDCDNVFQEGNADVSADVFDEFEEESAQVCVLKIGWVSSTAQDSRMSLICTCVNPSDTMCARVLKMGGVTPMRLSCLLMSTFSYVHVNSWMFCCVVLLVM